MTLLSRAIADPDKRAEFESKFTEHYAAAEEARTGMPVDVRVSMSETAEEVITLKHNYSGICPSLSDSEIGGGEATCEPGNNREGDVCRLTCREVDGYRLVGGDGVYTCSGVKHIGTGRCMMLQCASPPLPENGKSHIGPCAGAAGHGTNCGVECMPGYKAFGSYTCDNGQYISF